MASKGSRGPSERLELSRLELAVMNVVWELQECTSTEVIAAYQKQRRLAPTTIRTVLANLRKKGYLEQVPSIDRGFRLKPTVSREAVGRRSLREILASLFHGSLPQAMACLLNEEKLSEDDMQEIRRLLETARASNKRRTEQ